jgi:hypothetical protein
VKPSLMQIAALKKQGLIAQRYFNITERTKP